MVCQLVSMLTTLISVSNKKYPVKGFVRLRLKTLHRSVLQESYLIIMFVCAQEDRGRSV